MNEFDEYQFKIDAYSPETIPMVRLAQYLTALAKLMGCEGSVHFNRIDAGSTVPCMRVEKEAAPKVIRRLHDINHGVANPDAIRVFDDLNVLLRNDDATGVLSRRPRGEQDTAQILRFPGREIQPPKTFGPFTEPAVVDGELVRIGGKDKTAHAQIIDPEGKAWNGEMDRATAQELAEFLYKGPILRVRGDARWERDESSTWNLKSFKIRSFERLADDTLKEVTNRLRVLHDSDWHDIEDIDGFISAKRGDDEGLH